MLQKGSDAAGNAVTQSVEGRQSGLVLALGKELIACRSRA
jgi:hypothetical protein